ncbi:MAG: sigma-70 family RNA polymerase sigma factor [Gemmataceae bacterium]|nr:sigma-70 family RNA polymerase sigma factor [Gemmataceae bacterium]
MRLRDPEDGAAWREFVDLYTPLVYGYLRKQGLQDADAADLSQEALGAVAGAMGRFEYDSAKGAFRNWLFTVVRRRLLNWRLAQGHRVTGSGDTVTQELLEQRPAPAPDERQWDEEWERRLFAWACGEVRRTVNDATWQAFWMTAVEGRRGKEVAAELGMSVGAVYLARSRILSRLRALVRSAEEM